MERGGLNGTGDRLRHRLPACLGNVAQAPGAERRADRLSRRTETGTMDERRGHFCEPRQESGRLSADFLLACQLEGGTFPADISRDLETDAGDYVFRERQTALDLMQIGVGAEPITTFHLFEPAAEAVGAHSFDDHNDLIDPQIGIEKPVREAGSGEPRVGGDVEGAARNDIRHDLLHKVIRIGGPERPLLDPHLDRQRPAIREDEHVARLRVLHPTDDRVDVEKAQCGPPRCTTHRDPIERGRIEL